MRAFQLALFALAGTSAFDTSVRPTPTRPRAARPRAAAKMHGAFSMAALSSRISEVQQQPEPESVQLLMLDAMVPRQRYHLAAPAPLVETIVDSHVPLVMMQPHWPNLHTWDDMDGMWTPEREQQPASHGVEVTVAGMSPRSTDGDAIITLVAGRWCEVLSVSADEGSAASVRAGTARWRDLDARAPEEQPTPSVLQRSEALASLVDVWTSYMGAAGSDASVEKMDVRVRDLGPMPPADRPSDRALWVAALINPCPSGASGSLALEVRPAALCAPAAEARVRVVQSALEDSIERLRLWYSDT